jgi:proteasome lid subunit RPN8/RPN11
VVVGVYHSHPSAPAVPSSTDLEHATSAEYLYVIVSLAGERVGDEVRAYRLVGERFERVDLVVIES